nr:MAG TPA: hypothetical protein [Bacteriophage sp.]
MNFPQIYLPKCAALEVRAPYTAGNPRFPLYFQQQTKPASLTHRFTLAVSVLPFALTHHATYVVRYWR